jgi:[acyl-carrier-protein] S-malonyltransferase
MGEAAAASIPRLPRAGRIALMFPGQGAQRPGMGWSLAQRFPTARHTFEEADDLLGIGIGAACFHGSAARLRSTEICQPAILTVSVAALRVAEEHGLRGDIAMGHSLGEYAALVAAGTLSFSDALTVVARRGALAAGVARSAPGGMAALIGVPVSAVRALCREIGNVWLANDNCPGQVVVSGERSGIRRLVQVAGQRGMRVRLLEVDGAFHSRMMAPAATGLRAALAAVRLRAPTMQFLSATTAALEPVERVRAILGRQLTAPVRFTQTVKTAIHLGVERFVELGPARVLGGLVGRINSRVTTLHVGSAGDLACLDELATARWD